MQRLRNEKGITIATLVITIVVLLMISTPIFVNFSNIGTVKKYTSFKDDIDVLRESIEIAYRDDKDISSIGSKYEESLDMLNKFQGDVKVKNENDNDKYYVIDLKQLNEKLRVKIDKLNYGVRNQNSTDTSDDVYIINERSRTIYYVRGIEYKGIVYYRIQEEFSSNSEGVIPGEEVKGINKMYTDKYGSKAMIPVGYSVSTQASEQVISKGLVIKDSQGNEFVWIPTKSFYDETKSEINITFGRESFDGQSKGANDDITGSQKIYNGADVSHYFYEKMSDVEKKSVLEYDGFYIGRYEATSSTARDTSSENTEATVQVGKPIYNIVKKEDAISLSNNFAKNEYVTSRLCSSYAWDSALKFIKQTGNSSYLTDVAKGNHTNAVTMSGATSSDKINNIYDLGGNVYEWTLENNSNGNLSVVRGGAISSSDTAVTRKTVSDEANENIGFRITLFIK